MMCHYGVVGGGAPKAAGRYCGCEGRANKPRPTSPGLSDLWAQHGCHRSSTRSPLGMFVYIQSTPPLCLPLPRCVSASLPLLLLLPLLLSDLLQCGRQLGGWVSRGGEENGKRKGGGEGEAGGGRRREEEPPLSFFFSPPSAHAQCPPPLPVTLFITVHPPLG